MTTFHTAVTTSFGTPAAGRTTIWERLRKMAALAKQRRDLSRLSAEQLSDIGVSAQEAQEEAQRASWDVPQNWKN